MSRAPQPTHAGAPPLHEDVAPARAADGAQPGPAGPPDGDGPGPVVQPLRGRAGVPELERLFYALGMTMGRYLATVLLPLALMGAALAVLLPALLRDAAGPFVAGLLGPVVGAFLVGLGLLAPFLAREQRRNAINQAMHVFITHLGVLSTTPMARVDLFAAIAAKEGYGPLAGECGRIHGLVRHWRLSLPEACRFVGARTPSELLSDFLDRFAHALESGDRLEEYLTSEQAVVLHQYASLYQRRLKDLEGYRELFASLMMSAVFLAVFAVLMPVLTGGDAGALLPLVLLSTVGILAVLLGLAKAKAPNDPLWQRLGQRSDAERRALLALTPAAALGLLAGAAAWASAALPPGLVAAAAASPLAIAAVAMHREEEQIRRRDDNYPAFIRSLGAGSAARGGAPLDAVGQLARHDFGPLTPPIARLHRRLALGLDNALAWRLFAVETGSHLAATFNAMFLEATRDGGNPMKVGHLISANATQVLALRKQRAQIAAGLRGTMLGMAGAVAFTLHLNVGILGMLTGLFADMDVATAVLPGVGGAPVDLALVGLFVAVLALLYSVAAALAMRLVAGGRLQGSFGDLALMLWITGGVGLLAGTVVQGLL